MSPRKVITGKAEKPSPEPRWRGAARPRRRESKAARKERALRLLEVLDRAYPHSHCSLDHRNEFELLIATILSAQCTDARVNMVTPELFRRAPGPAALARLSQEDLEELVKTTGFFRNKAKSIKGAAEAIVAEHGGKVPATMEALLSLPGVARKTANVVLGTGYGIASGVVVDTHVQRISQLLRLTEHDDPKKIEQDLMELLPEDHWIRFAHQMIDHGRAICIARRPKCPACPLNPLCPSAGIGGDNAAA